MSEQGEVAALDDGFVGCAGAELVDWPLFQVQGNLASRLGLARYVRMGLCRTEMPLYSDVTRRA